MKLYCATTNPGKLREFRLAAQGHVEIEPLETLAVLPACVEDGATFEENAVKKALFYSGFSDSLTLADDSGLEIDFLNAFHAIQWHLDFHLNYLMINKYFGEPKM